MKLLFYMLIALVSATSSSLAQEQIGTQAVWLEEPYIVTSDTQSGEYLQVFAVDESSKSLFGRFWNLSTTDQRFIYMGFGWVSQEDTHIGGEVMFHEIPEQVDCEIQEPTPFLVEVQIQTSWVVDTIISCEMFLRNYDGTRFWTLFETTQGFFMLENEESVFGWSYPLDTVIGDGTCTVDGPLCEHILDAIGTRTNMNPYNSHVPVTIFGETPIELSPMSVYTQSSCTIESEINVTSRSQIFVGEIGCKTVALSHNYVTDEYFLYFYWGVLPLPENSRLIDGWIYPADYTDDYISNVMFLKMDDSSLSKPIKIIGSISMGSLYVPR